MLLNLQATVRGAELIFLSKTIEYKLMNVIRLTACESVFQAYLYKGRLKNESISSFIANENFTTLMPHYYGILGSGAHVMISENDYSRAVEVLELNIKRKLICPDCNSVNIVKNPFKYVKTKVFFIIVSILIAVPFGNINTSYFCKDCKREFN